MKQVEIYFSPTYKKELKKLKKKTARPATARTKKEKLSN